MTRTSSDLEIKKRKSAAKILSMKIKKDKNGRETVKKNRHKISRGQNRKERGTGGGNLPKGSTKEFLPGKDRGKEKYQVDHRQRRQGRSGWDGQKNGGSEPRKRNAAKRYEEESLPGPEEVMRSKPSGQGGDTEQIGRHKPHEGDARLEKNQLLFNGVREWGRKKATHTGVADYKKPNEKNTCRAGTI